MTIIHESEVPEVEHPGRFMRWLANEDSLPAKNLSVCVIRVMPGETVRPAHSHPNSEELIYIITGSGEVMIEGEVGKVKTGSAVLFEQGKVHMLRNTSDIEMKVICFFAPATNIDNYKIFENISFPAGK
jgi:quercetin dioxygenase-like cupin family protein